MSETPEERRRRGLEKMSEVYGWEFQDGPGDFFGYTVDHLFADIWNRPGLYTSERRLLLVGLLAGAGSTTCWRSSSVRPTATASSTPRRLREIVVFLAHYAGWPVAARLNNVVEKILAS